MDPSPPSKPVVDPHVEGAAKNDDLRVPELLLRKLHQANERFHAARLKIGQIMDDNEYRHVERIQQSEDDLRKAELEVEAIEKEIREFLVQPLKT